MSENKVSTKVELTMSERFVQKVTAEFTSGTGELRLTPFQKRLAQNYFIVIDAVLKTAEEKRQNKTRNQDPVPVTWNNINMELLARNVVSAARIGLDPAQKNHIHPIPYKNNTTGKYDLAFIEGYRGIEVKATKYGLDIPDGVIVELVYKNDRFKSIKKDRNNPVETFEFEIVNEFDRGEIIGGFYYHIFTNNPEKNKLVVFSLKDILKRKPKYASPEFWGGEKDKWEGGKKVGKETIDGWYDEMCYKTIYRAAYGNITIDSQKIDDDYVRMSQMEQSLKEAEVAEEIAVNANTETIDIDAEVVEEKPAEESKKPAPETKQPEPEKSQEFEWPDPDLPATGTDGPSF
jgi:recombination protein RecT